MTNRYYSEEPLGLGRASLAGAEAHHLIHVMRARPGTEVTLFDGSGAEFPARVVTLDRNEVELEVNDCRQVDRESSWAVTLGVALPKGDRQRWLVEKAVELGCARMVPLRTERSVAEPTAGASKRLQRGVVEACKQCGRNRLMEIAPAEDWPSFVELMPPQALRLMAHPSPSRSEAASAEASLREAMAAWQPRREVALAIGPEGGFTDEERERAITAGWRAIDLGPRILRTETAAVALMAIIPTLLHAGGTPSAAPKRP